MVARIKLVYPPKSDSIKIEIQQHNKIDEILRRVVNFWIQGGDPDDYILIKDDRTIDKDKTVDEAGIVGGDELKLMGKARLGSVRDFDENVTYEKKSDDVKDSNDGGDVEIRNDKRLNVAESWLEKNIGINPESLTVVESYFDQNNSKIVFSDEENDCFYTIEMENGDITRYVPIYENKGEN